MLNQVQIMGFLGQDPELRYTPSGQACANLSVATTETWLDNSGAKQSHTEWHRVVVWGKPAENCSKYLAKGKGVHVAGKIRTRSWQDNSGAKKYATEIIAKEVLFLPGGGTGQNNQRPQNQGQPPGQSQRPHQEHRQGGVSPVGPAADHSLPPNLDDIPF